MKTFNFLLIVIFVSIALNSGSYAARDTLPPIPLFDICPCCGENHLGQPYVVDMPRNADRSNLGSIVVNSSKSFNYRFTYADFIPGIDTATGCVADLIDRSRDAQLVVTFTDFAGNDTTTQYNYYARKMMARNNLDFGLLAVGESKELDCWIINESSINDTLTALKFKYNNQGFEILNISIPCIIESKDSIKFKIRFTASQNGEFKDSMGVESYCYDKYLNKVYARVGSPRIDVSYFDFGDVSVNTIASGSVKIQNNGTTDLIITGYTGPRQSNLFILDLSEISESNPLKLYPFQVLQFNVIFKPTQDRRYTDSIFFISNTEKVNNPDSVADLFGRGIRADLQANSYDWGRRRIDRVNFPAGPYDPDSGYQVIKLENRGSQAVSIRDIRIISDVNGSAFEFDRSKLQNRTIPDSNYIIVPVRFHPKVPGTHELIIEYDNTAGSNTQTILRGIGTVPQIETSDYDFGTTKLMDTANPSSRLIRITNKSAADWIYGDSVIITSLDNFSFGMEISPIPEIWGSEGFRFDGYALKLPVKLGQGESLEFNAQFAARKISQSKGILAIHSDADKIEYSAWTGYGIDAAGLVISVSDADFGKVLRYSEKTKKIYINNLSDSNLKITNYTIPVQKRYIVDITREISDNNPLIIQPHEAWSFDVDFNSAEETRDNFRDSIVFSSNATQGDSISYLKVDSVVISGVEDITDFDEQIIIYPNPADDFLLINFQDMARKPDCIRLFDMFGNVVYENRNMLESASGVTPDAVTIRTREFASGMYFLNIGNTFIKKIIVVH